MTRSVLHFQETFAQKSTQKIEKYLKLIGQTGTEGDLDTPTWLVPPYFYDPDIRGTSYIASLEIARIAAETHGEHVHPVVCVLKSALDSTDGVDRLVDDYAPFAQTLLFFSRFDEFAASEPQLRGFLRTARGLSQRGRRAFTLFGGYFSILAHYAGLEGLSHGIGYGESRDALSPESGPPPKRFYIPALHRFFSIADALTLIAQDRKGRKLFQCACGACEEAISGGRGSLDRRTRDDSFHHFLLVRHDELGNVQGLPLANSVATLQDVYDYAVSIAPHLSKELGYLKRWASAIQTP